MKKEAIFSAQTLDRHHWTAAVEAEKICGNKNHVPLRDPYSSLDFLFHTDALLLFPPSRSLRLTQQTPLLNVFHSENTKECPLRLPSALELSKLPPRR